MQTSEVERQHPEDGEQQPNGENEQHPLLHGQLTHMTAPHIAEHHADDRRQDAECEK